MDVLRVINDKYELMPQNTVMMICQCAEIHN